MKNRLVSVACVAALLGSISRADEKPDLTEAERAQLQRDKILITDRTYRQVFSPYVFSPKPVFITADSVLNAWRVLLEEAPKDMLPAKFESVSLCTEGCHGAVMPFHEMRSGLLLMDTEWLETLNGKDAPHTPEWLRPVTTAK